MKKAVFIALLFASFWGVIAPTAQAQVQLQLGFLIDGSGSIRGSDFQIVVNALATALADPTLVPQDGSLEVVVVQFSDATATVEVPPTVLTATTLPQITQQIRTMGQGRGGTPLWSGLDTIVAQMRGSANFNVAQRRTINVATDGEPQLPDSNISVAQGTQLSLEARDRAISAGIDEIDAEGVGQATNSTSFQNFLLSLVWPQPGTLVTDGGTFDPGFVTLVTQFQDFEQAIRNKIGAILITAGVTPGGRGGEGGTGGQQPPPPTPPGGQPIPFDTPWSLALLTATFAVMLVALRVRERRLN